MTTEATIETKDPDWRRELALFLRELTGLAKDGRKLLGRELETTEGQVVMRFDESEAAALTEFMRVPVTRTADPVAVAERMRVVQGILRRAVTLRG